MSVTSETVIHVGSDDLQNRMGKVRAALAAGGTVHWVHLLTGRHRAWITRERPEGAEVTRLSCHRFAAQVGQVADDIREGITYEVWDHQRNEPAFYATLAPPEELVRSGAALRYMTRARRGTLARSLWLEFPDPVSVQAKAVS